MPASKRAARMKSGSRHVAATPSAYALTLTLAILRAGNSVAVASSARPSMAADAASGCAAAAASPCRVHSCGEASGAIRQGPRTIAALTPSATMHNDAPPACEHAQLQASRIASAPPPSSPLRTSLQSSRDPDASHNAAATAPGALTKHARARGSPCQGTSTGPRPSIRVACAPTHRRSRRAIRRLCPRLASRGAATTLEPGGHAASACRTVAHSPSGHSSTTSAPSPAAPTAEAA